MAGEHPRAGVDYPRNWHESLEWFPDGGGRVCATSRLLEGAVATDPHPYKAFTSETAA